MYRKFPSLYLETCSSLTSRKHNDSLRCSRTLCFGIWKNNDKMERQNGNETGNFKRMLTISIHIHIKNEFVYTYNKNEIRKNISSNVFRLLTLILCVTERWQLIGYNIICTVVYTIKFQINFMKWYMTVILIYLCIEFNFYPLFCIHFAGCLVEKIILN